MADPRRPSSWLFPLVFTAIGGLSILCCTSVVAWAVTESRVTRVEQDVAGMSKRLEKMQVIQIRMATKMEVDTRVDD